MNQKLNLVLFLVFLVFPAQANTEAPESFRALCAYSATLAKDMYIEKEKGQELTSTIAYKTLTNIFTEAGSPDFMEDSLIPFFDISLKKMSVDDASKFYYHFSFNRLVNRPRLIKHLANGISLFCNDKEHDNLKNKQECIQNVVGDYIKALNQKNS